MKSLSYLFAKLLGQEQPKNLLVSSVCYESSIFLENGISIVPFRLNAAFQTRKAVNTNVESFGSIELFTTAASEEGELMNIEFIIGEKENCQR